MLKKVGCISFLAGILCNDLGRVLFDDSRTLYKNFTCLDIDKFVSAILCKRLGC